MLKILSKNIEKYRIQERTNFGPILIGPFLLNLCHGHTFVLFTFFQSELRDFYRELPDTILKIFNF